MIPEEAALTSNTWMGGVFHAMVTQGHVSINRFLSTTHSYLGLFRGNGLRLFVELSDGWHLLDVPSAFEMTPERSRWIYKHPTGCIEIRSGAPADRHELTLSAAVTVRRLCPLSFVNHVALNGDDGIDAVPVRYRMDEEGVFVQPTPESDVGRRFPDGGFRIVPLPGTIIERIGGDELLFADGRSRESALSLHDQRVGRFHRFPTQGVSHLRRPGKKGRSGTMLNSGPTSPATSTSIRPPRAPLADAAKRFEEILPWFIQNTLIHYLAPRGLEQYTGGGWGTRDISQGPVELFLGLGRHEPIRDILIRLFKTQNPDGDWPQWFMFFDRERNIRAGDSHGDIVFWPVLALAQYLIASEDGTLLDESCLSFIRRETIGLKRPRYGNMWSAPWPSSATGSFPAPGLRPTAMGTGTTRCSRLTRPCGSDFAAPGP